MDRWRQLGWTCAIILVCAEYSWLATIDRIVPPIPELLIGVQAVLFPAAVFAMIGTPAYIAALVYNVAKRRPTTLMDVAVAVTCVSLTVVVLRW